MLFAASGKGSASSDARSGFSTDHAELEKRWQSVSSISATSLIDTPCVRYSCLLADRVEPQGYGPPLSPIERSPGHGQHHPARHPQGDSDTRSERIGTAVARTTDGGQSWHSLRNGLPQENTYDIVLRHALDIAGDTLCFGSTTGNVYLSEDRGENWQCLGNHFPPIYSVRFG